MSATSTMHAVFGQSQQPKFDGRMSGTREDKIDFPENRRHYKHVGWGAVLFCLVLRCCFFCVCCYYMTAGWGAIEVYWMLRPGAV